LNQNRIVIMQGVELGSDIRCKEVKNRQNFWGNVESRCRPSSLRSFSLLLVLALFGALVAFVSVGGWGIGGFRRFNLRQPCQPCEETLISSWPNGSAKTLPSKYETISEIYSTYDQTPGLDH